MHARAYVDPLQSILPVGRGYSRLLLARLLVMVTRRQAVHQRNFAGSRTLPSLDSIIHYYTLYYLSVCITSMHAYIDCWCVFTG